MFFSASVSDTYEEHSLENLLSKHCVAVVMEYGVEAALKYGGSKQFY